MTKDKAKRRVQVEIEDGVSTAALNGTKVEISPEVKPDRTQQKVRVFLKDGTLLTTLDWKKCFTRPAGTEPVSVDREVGFKMADGSVFAGRTADGKQRIYAMPNDLDVCMTFNDAAKAVTTLNNDKALGHDDWQIPSKKNLLSLQKKQNEGALKGTFNTPKEVGDSCPGLSCPDEYWSSTKDRVFPPSGVWSVRFSDSNLDWHIKDNFRLSCRPVRLVAVSTTPAHRRQPATG